MDGLTLLDHARLAGLQIHTDGDRLVVEGPRRLEPIAQRLLADKASVMRALADEHEVAWRIEAMRPQAPPSGAIPLLLARPRAMWGPGCCCSCGDPLGPGDRYRCRPCVAAGVAVLDNVR